MSAMLGGFAQLYRGVAMFTFAMVMAAMLESKI